ncbi:MAG: hypothetical protein K0Q50_2493 [Vampirovibrio sp.]|nr:hypothetical protein [Vampirovibrio sp.]
MISSRIPASHTNLPAPPSRKPLPGASNPAAGLSAALAKTGADQIKFGGKDDAQPVETVKSADKIEAPAEKFTWGRFLKDLRGHMQHAENKQVLKGLAYKYGPDLSLPILFMVPVLGWIAAVFMIPVAWICKKWGDNILKKANLDAKDGKLSPIKQIAKLEKLWNEKPTEGMTDKLVEEFNMLTKSLFPDNDCPKAKSLRDMLTITRDKKAFRLLSHAVNARLQYSDMLASKILSPLGWLGKHMPLKSLGMLIALPELAIQGSLMLKSHQKELAAKVKK